MATSTLKFYRNTKLQESKNFVIDEINLFLTNYLLFTRSNFQYFKDFEIETTIKIDLEQSYINPVDVNNIDYLSVQNSDMPNSLFFYFVLSKRWKGESTILFNLRLDTLNTFTYNKSFVFSDKTRILRQHKNRFKLLSSAPTRKFYTKLIDLESEGFTLPTYKTKEEILQDEYNYLKWYLYYKSDTEKIINAYLIPSQTITIQYATPYNIKNVITDYKVILLTSTNGNLNVKLGNKVISFSSEVKSILIWCVINDSNDFLGNVYAIHYNNKVVYNVETFSIENQSLVIEGDYNSYYTNANTYNNDTTINALINKNYNDLLSEVNQLVTIEKTYTTGTLKSIAEFSRNSPTITKVFELPYCPILLNKNEQGFILSDLSFTYNEVEKTLDLNFLEANFQNTLQFEKPLFNEKNFSVLNNVNLNTLEKSPDYEPKLLHSDFLKKSFIYDTFSYLFKFELLSDNFYFSTADSKFTFKTTNTINSNFMFKFDDYILKFSEQNYEGFLYCNRNNEITTYNNDYINYINNGYNYDKKQQQLNNLSTWANVGLNLANKPSYTGAIGSITNAIFSSMQNSLNIEKKLADLSLKNASVYGADDIDLLSFYANDNKAKIVTYEVSEKMKNLLFNLFYYTGYISNTFGMPNLTTRTRFNYIQCEIVFESINNMSEEHKEDLEDKFLNGVTYIHHYDDTWDLNQKFENWETLFFGN